MKEITLVSEDPSFGAAADLVLALEKAGHQVRSIFLRKDPKDFWKKIPKAYYLEQGGKTYVPEHLPDELIIVGSSSWDMITVMSDNDALNGFRTRCKVILTDSHYVRNHERLNKEFEEARVTVFAMPDLFQYRASLRTYPFYQALNVGEFSVRKNKNYTIAHSPGPKLKSNEKGSQQIAIKVFKHILINPDSKYLVISNMSNTDCLAAKAGSHVFIDQMVLPGHPYGYKGGLGKSGLEAMLLGSLVITGGEDVEHDQFPKVPVLRYPLEKLSDALQYWKDNPNEREEMAEIQREWAHRHLSYEFVAEHILKYV